MKLLIVLLALVSCSGEPEFRDGDRVFIRKLTNKALFENCKDTATVVNYIDDIAGNRYTVIIDNCMFIDTYDEELLVDLTIDKE